MIKIATARCVLLLSPLLLLTACGAIGNASDNFDTAQYNASPAGIAESQAREAERMKEVQILHEKKKQVCLSYQADWRKTGYDIGTRGGNAQYYNSTLRDCERYKLKFNQKQWEAGYQQGLKDSYCVYNTALYVGPEYAFNNMMETCSPLLSERQRQNMLIFFTKGRIIADQKSELSDAKYELSQLENKLRYSDDSETSREDRREYRSLKRTVADLQYRLELLHSEAQRLILETGGR